MTVLYRTYRPKTFADVEGQEHVKAALANEAATGRVAHSYLFSGPRGVGKTSIARIFAKALNCGARKKDGEPCGACGACTEIAEGRAIDVIEIDAASHTGVDNVREQVIENARFAPASMPRKIFIIDEVHMLSTSAFNALLKTLEEPPKDVVFILATTEPQKLPATVVSRCQRFEFRKIPSAAIVERLGKLAGTEGYEVDREVLETIARLSEGCLRDAESLLSQVFALGEKKVTPETAALVLPMVSSETVDALLAALAAKDAAGAFEAWERLLAAGSDPVRVIGDLAERCRAEVIRLVKGEATGFCLPAMASLLERLVRAHAEMKRLDPPELGFELMLVEWCVARDAAPAQGREDDKKEPPRLKPPTPKAEAGDSAPERQAEPPQERAAPSAALMKVKERWTEVLAAAQKRNHGLPYMLGAAELLGCEEGTLTVGFQYKMYRDRLNERRHKDMLEAALEEVLDERLAVQAVLVAQRVDGLVESAPGIRVEPTAAKSLPDGFADLVKEFGGTVA